MPVKQAKKDNKLSTKYYALQGFAKDWYYGIQIGASYFLLITSSFPPKIDEEGKIILEPEAVTETRTLHLRNRLISEYLIKWKDLPAKYSTWEDENFDTEASKTTQALRKTLV